MKKQNDTKDVFLRCLLDSTIFHETNNRDALIAYTLFLTGMNPSELIAMKIANIDLKRDNIISHTKFRISTKAKFAFRELISNQSKNSYLFATTTGKPLTTRRIEQIINKLSEKFESQYTTPRSLRKLFLERTIEQNKEQIPLNSVQFRETLTLQEQKSLKRILKTQSLRNKALLLTQLELGLRVNEILQLQTHHIKNNHLIISKECSYNGLKRKIKISEQLGHLLFSLKSNNYLFSKNKPLTQRRFEQITKEVGLLAGIEQLTPSLLRATAIKQLLETKTESQVKEQTGLQSSNLLYTHGFLKTTSSILYSTLELPTSTIKELERKDNQNTFSSSNIYRRTRTRRGGGDADE